MRRGRRGPVKTDKGHDWSRTTAEAVTQNRFAVASALSEKPMQAPPS